MHPDAIDRVLRKYAKAIGLDRGYSAHSMRAKLAERYKHGELEALEKDLHESAAIENQLDVVGNLTEDFVKKFARTRQLEYWCTTLFVIMFALGSFVVALDFVRRSRRVTSGAQFNSQLLQEAGRAPAAKRRAQSNLAA